MCVIWHSLLKLVSVNFYFPEDGYCLPDFQFPTNEEAKVNVENKKRGCPIKPLGLK